MFEKQLEDYLMGRTSSVRLLSNPNLTVPMPDHVNYCEAHNHLASYECPKCRILEELKTV